VFKLLGRFRWIFCQLQVLRDCLPPSVRRTLKELPESLDETYERILKEIKKPNRCLAQRVLQCLVVAIRPLHVTELAEVLAVDFDDSEGIARLNADWRWEDQEQALLIACSSLIAIVEAGDGDSDVESSDSRVVQFSHFSVKEFLTSSRLSTVNGEVSGYRIDLENAHTILGQACLGVLLQTQDEIDGNTSKDHPLAIYAAEHWTTHAQFGEVSSRLKKAMEYLFDPGKPHFRAWLTLYDIDPDLDEGTFDMFTLEREYPGTPLYYAALCGFHDLVEHLIAKYPQDVDDDGGIYMRPLIAALAGEHFQTADLLRHNGADPLVQGHRLTIPLHSAAYYENFEVVQKLIEYGADIDAEDRFGWTPLSWASRGHFFKDGSVHRLLLEHGADVNSRADDDGFTPLHRASQHGALEIVCLLLEHGADVEAVNHDGKTALQVVGETPSYRPIDPGRCDETRRLLVEHGAKGQPCGI
jgi:Ankyrin repeats (3 copies)